MNPDSNDAITMMAQSREAQRKREAEALTDSADSTNATLAAPRSEAQRLLEAIVADDAVSTAFETNVRAAFDKLPSDVARQCFDLRQSVDHTAPALHAALTATTPEAVRTLIHKLWNNNTESQVRPPGWSFAAALEHRVRTDLLWNLQRHSGVLTGRAAMRANAERAIKDAYTAQAAFGDTPVASMRDIRKGDDGTHVSVETQFDPRKR